MPKTGGFLEPLVFVVIMGLVAGVIHVLLNFIGLGQAAGMMSGFGVIIVLPIAAAVGSFVGAAILFVIWKLMGSQENYETAYRCGAYLSALAPVTAIISAVPYAGGMINMAIYIYFLVTASIYVHHLPSQKAWLVFGIIGVILALMTVYAEYKTRNMGSEMEKWRRMGGDDMRQEYRESTKDAEKSADEMRKQAERMTQEYEQQRRLQEKETD